MYLRHMVNSNNLCGNSSGRLSRSLPKDHVHLELNFVHILNLTYSSPRRVGSSFLVVSTVSSFPYTVTHEFLIHSLNSRPCSPDTFLFFIQFIVSIFYRLKPPKDKFLKQSSRILDKPRRVQGIERTWSSRGKRFVFIVR